MSGPNPLVTVASFRDPWEAHIVRGRLNAEDVLAFVIHENHAWMNWPISLALGGVKIQVPAGSIDSALQILAAVKAGKYADVLEDYEPVFDNGPCPRCTSLSLTPKFSVRDRISLVILFLFFGITYPAQRSWNRCRNCHNIWNRELKA
ncbi:MAG TPA: hypothetical protein VGV16_09105 [Gammaproteobacteria bacterium]|nr:hypothetical protein [Gammaproteobacteria bacterium]